MFDLTRKEMKVFNCLSAHIVASKADLLTDAWGIPAEIADRINTRMVDVTVGRIRKKLPETITIETVRGVGYSLLVG